MGFFKNNSDEYALKRFAGYSLLAVAIAVSPLVVRFIRDMGTATGGVLLRNVSYTLETDHGIIEVDYPQFTGSARGLNKEIMKYVEGVRVSFEENARENARARRETATSPEELALAEEVGKGMYLLVDWEKAQIDNKRVSVLIRTSAYSGGAHGGEFTKSFNWDMKRHRVLALSELFPGDKDYLSHLSKISIERLSEKFKDEEGRLDDGALNWIKEGTAPKIENFSVFTINGDVLRIYFQEYQVAPYVAGAPHVDIDISQIGGVNTENGSDIIGVSAD
jgi:hypothetical protein